jgi:hypothetical protein
MEKNQKLTICSVSYNSWDLLNINWDLVSLLNRENSNWTWVIVNNQIKTTPNYHPFLRNPKCFITDGEQLDNRLPIKYRGSFHHGVGLNKSLSHIKTRFGLFLDPDFFIVFGKDWINSIVNHMLQNDLSFFGPPWHPKWYIKYRYFPCPHCLFIDLKKVPIESLDFTPDYGINDFSKSKNLKRSERGSVKENMTSAPSHGNGLRPIKGFYRLMKKMSIGKRKRSIGRSRDTGFKIYWRYGHNPKVKHNGPIPVYKPYSNPSTERFIVSPLNRFIELFLPDRLTYRPKRSHLYSRKGFKELGYPDIDGLGWEEFLWKGKPFGFHLRGQKLLSPKDQSDTSFIKAILLRFAQNINY